MATEQQIDKADEAAALPQSVRYVKNGEGGKWWPAALSKGQIHAGWQEVPDELLLARDLESIKALSPEQRGNTADLNALLTLIDRPSQHVWITFQDGCLWWCTVKDAVGVNPAGVTSTSGHFWLSCDRPWSRSSLNGRYLAMADLPGIATTTSGFKGTVCKPSAMETILRIIKDEDDADVLAASAARVAYEQTIEKLVARLSPKDFEQLTDLILARDGWVRVGKLGGVVEGVDLEVENASADEMAFVQVKSSSTQKTVDDYVVLFSSRRERYARMIFVVHTSSGRLQAPIGLPVQIWDRERVAQLVVRHGLAKWVAERL